MLTDNLIEQAKYLLKDLRRAKLKLATAESCTGGLIAAVLTEVPGSSDVVDRAFVTYSNPAKMALLDVPDHMLTKYGAVSAQTARAMAKGALAHSDADVTVAVTGVAGPGGGSAKKPVGLVHIAAATRKGGYVHRKCLFGDIGRSEVRIKTVETAFKLIWKLLKN